MPPFEHTSRVHPASRDYASQVSGEERMGSRSNQFESFKVMDTRLEEKQKVRLEQRRRDVLNSRRREATDNMPGWTGRTWLMPPAPSSPGAGASSAGTSPGYTTVHNPKASPGPSESGASLDRKEMVSRSQNELMMR